MSTANVSPSNNMATVFKDAVAGFLVFLIAMPLCLAIANASGYPPICGIWTAVIGGIFCSFITDSQLTIKGPAAGLIVIVAGSVTAFADHYGLDLKDPAGRIEAFRYSIGIGVVSGVIQVLFGVFRFGKIIDFFPMSAVHGMLASIGLIIISKQAYPMLGIKPAANVEPLHLLIGLPEKLGDTQISVAIIGLTSLFILFSFFFLPFKASKKIPSQLVVLLVAIPVAQMFEPVASYYLNPETKGVFINVPSVLKEPAGAFFLPNFDGLFTLVGAQYLLLFCLIGSLESMLSAKAVDLLDPLKRKSNMDRDLIAVGVANTAVAFIGGLPMISEIVRSSANINNGAQTRAANRFHGIFLLAFVLLLPGVINMIPMAALAAMLVFTGYRLASPNEFVKTWQIGPQQLMVFVGTIIVTLATDLLIGILSGVAIQFFLNLWNGSPFTSTFMAPVQIDKEQAGVHRVVVSKSATFSNWMSLRSSIVSEGFTAMVIVDLSETKFVDHSVMEKLHELEHDFHRAGGNLTVSGLQEHKAETDHPTASRRKLPLPAGVNPFSKI
jgi:MFS superfamily sulfate permease-like transporter